MAKEREATKEAEKKKAKRKTFKPAGAEPPTLDERLKGGKAKAKAKGGAASTAEKPSKAPSRATRKK